jgi:hypothetical protein
LAVKGTIHAEVDAALAAEVCMLRAVRDDLETTRARLEAEVARRCDENEFLRTRVADLVAFRDAADAFRARVEALAAKWREHDWVELRDCAEDIEVALRGPT